MGEYWQIILFSISVVCCFILIVCFVLYLTTEYRAKKHAEFLLLVEKKLCELKKEEFEQLLERYNTLEKEIKSIKENTNK